MLTHITTSEKLKEEAEEIQSFLEITISDNIEEAKQRATDLSVYNARTGKMLADAKYHLADKMKSEVMDIIRFQAKDAYATAKATNLLCDSVCRDEKYLVDWIERLNRSTVHQIDLIRTFISLEKELMKNSPMQP
jgi:hypothetical protein